MGLFNNAIYIAELAENHTANEIAAFKAKVREALQSRVSINLHVSASSQEGLSTSGIALSTPQDQLDFIASCRAALSQIDSGVAATPDSGAYTNYAHSRVQT